MSVGEALAEARTKAGLSVDEVSARTRIRETVIRGIEQDDYEACGGDLFVRGYVRVLADALGVDAQPLIREYDQVHPGRMAVTAPDGAQKTNVPEPPADDAAAAEVAATAIEKAEAAKASNSPEPAEPAPNAAGPSARPPEAAQPDAISQPDTAPKPDTTSKPDTTREPGTTAESGNAAEAALDVAARPPADTEFGLPAAQASEPPEPAPEAAAPEPAPPEAAAPEPEPAPPEAATPPQPEPAHEEPEISLIPGMTEVADVQETRADLPVFAVADTRSDLPVIRPSETLADTQFDLDPVRVDQSMGATPEPAAGLDGPPRPGPVPKVRTRSRRSVTALAVLSAAVLVIVGVAVSHIVSSVHNETAATTASSGKLNKPGQPSAMPRTVSAPAKSEPAKTKSAKSPAARPGGKKATAGAKPKASPRVAPASPGTPAPPAATRLAIQRAEAFGPNGTADGDNESAAADAITPGAPGPWRTDWYRTPRFGNLQDGTGLLLDMGKTVTVTTVRVDLGPNRGADLELRAGNVPALGDLAVAESVNGTGGVVTLHLASPVRARYLLLWFTLLPPVASNQYQASVYSVAVTGQP